MSERVTSDAPAAPGGVMSKSTNDIATIVMGVILAVVATPQFTAWVSRVFQPDPMQQKQIDDLSKKIEKLMEQADKPAKKAEVRESLDRGFAQLEAAIGKIQQDAVTQSDKTMQEQIDALLVEQLKLRREVDTLLAERRTKQAAQPVQPIQDALPASAAVCEPGGT